MAHSSIPFPQDNKTLQILYVHGMGRTPLSGWRMLRRLQQSGHETQTFGYFVCAQDFSAIVMRLRSRIMQFATCGDYALIGHSLGGVLLRAALGGLPADTRILPKRLFLLGSPVQPTTLAKRLHTQPLYRILAGDCGQLLASSARMSAIGPTNVPTTAIIGVKGLPSDHGPFNGPNDGVVSVAETTADWLKDRIEVPVMHTWLPASHLVADIVLDRLRVPRTHATGSEPAL